MFDLPERNGDHPLFQQALVLEVFCLFIFTMQGFEREKNTIKILRHEPNQLALKCTTKLQALFEGGKKYCIWKFEKHKDCVLKVFYEAINYNPIKHCE